MITRATLLIIFVLSTAMAMAIEPDLSKLPPPAKQPGVTYAKEIRPLLEASCFRCHNAEKQKADLRLDSLEAVLQGSENGKIVVPGDSAKSPLVIAVSGLDEEHAMPPKRKPGGPRGPGRPGPRAGTQNPPGGPDARPAGDPSRPTQGGQGRPPGAGFEGRGGPGGGGGGGGPMSKPLTPEQVGLVRAWVDQGAR